MNELVDRTGIGLGDTVLISRPHCGLWRFFNIVEKRQAEHHVPWVEGTVTARGDRAIRVRYRRWGISHQRWFSLADPFTTITKTWLV